MAKFVVFAAIMIALFALAQANRFTITTTVDEDDMPYGQAGGQSQGRCQQQVQQRQRQIRACQQYLAARQRSPFEMEMLIEQQGQQQQHEQFRNQCCRVLQNFNDQCRCDAVREAVRQQELRQQEQQGQQQPQQQQQQQQQLRQIARFLPQQCNLGPQECQV